MKKLFIAAVAVLAFSSANAQEAGFKAGINAGMPIGVAGDIYSFSAGLDLAYMWPVADKFEAGVASGYGYYAGKEFFGVKVNGGFIPVAASGKYSFSDNMFGGLDLGYAVYAGSGGGDGGIYYQPKVGYQTEKMEVYLGYKGVSVTGGSIATVGLGVNFKF